ncbi:YifB family Mg chelatase-like AAA ATPase [Treponema endosymbiont of Eucomonympha sp.]|uniref:YifB family Mg chelatase-like AAA ATPase n=1 Tax=Treponema endosymbiont of Eucomonympha sp. TaxID=1580831 RepID=UPI000780AB9C|nr:YifB family Mg chelatase-like AAA ATPase [Treponema endosymbiont of Eucomonympha sp.]
MNVYSFSPFGYEGSLVAVEVDLRRGIPAIDMVGLAGGAVRESRERTRVAIKNSGFEFPPERILINLSPADIKKDGAGFDLAIALAVLAAKEPASGGALPAEETGAVLVMGELELSGRIRPVRGVFAAVSSALEQGIRRCIVPLANGAEAEAGGMAVSACDTLAEAFAALKDCAHEIPSPEAPRRNVRDGTVEFPEMAHGFEFAGIKRQGQLVRALQIAAAGAHNLLAYGPPGCGKTLALSRFPALLPFLTDEEARPVTRIHSLAGYARGEPLIRTPPFRVPHQSASLEGIAGGGRGCMPGEVSLAHNGALFLDEAAEFRSNVLQTLRVPLEAGEITVSRAGRNSVYPASFQLLVAANPCPCGNFGSRDKVCLCSARSVEQYWKKFSAPLLDRIDLRVPVFPEAEPARGAQRGESLFVPAAAASTAELRVAVGNAVRIQRQRQGKRNRFLSPEEIRQYCVTDGGADAALSCAAADYGFSARGTASCLKLARTIADMDGREVIGEAHMKEAVLFRKHEGGFAFSF